MGTYSKGGVYPSPLAGEGGVRARPSVGEREL